MSATKQPDPAAEPVDAGHRRQVLFYAADGLLGGTFTCSRCGSTGRQPDIIDHVTGCSYRAGASPPA